MTQEQLREGWEKRLMDEFCVMFERAHRENGFDGDMWAGKMEDFIRQTLLSQRQAYIAEIEGKIEGMKMIVTSEEAYIKREGEYDHEFYEYETGCQTSHNAALDSILTLLQDYKKHEK